MSDATTRYLGLDVHKEMVTMAVADASGAPTLVGTVRNRPDEIRQAPDTPTTQSARSKTS